VVGNCHALLETVTILRTDHVCTSEIIDSADCKGDFKIFCFNFNTRRHNIKMVKKSELTLFGGDEYCNPFN
jgi:hypothetical protein